jgi:hypothetical protein
MAAHIPVRRRGLPDSVGQPVQHHDAAVDGLSNLADGVLKVAVPLIALDHRDHQPDRGRHRLFSGSAGVMVTSIVMVSLRQRITPNRLLGRLTSAHRLVGWGTKPLGAALGGALAAGLGLRPVFAVAALLPLLAVVSLVRSSDLRPHSIDRT